MNNDQKHYTCINVPSSQTFRSYELCDYRPGSVRKYMNILLRVCCACFYALVGSLNLDKHKLSSKTKTLQIKYFP
jgi:hypothetical protein